MLSALVGTGGMTRLTTAPQRGIIGDRCQTDHTWFGLSHQAKGSKSGQELKFDVGDDAFEAESRQFLVSELVT